MKAKMRLLGILVVLVFLIMAQPSVSSGYTFDKFWRPNDSDIFTVELTPTTGPGSLYMYDWEEGKTDALFLLDGDYEGGTTEYLSYELREVTTDDDYRLYMYDNNTLMRVVGHDATPIPFPASALLFASGIVGLIAFGRVRRIS